MTASVHTLARPAEGGRPPLVPAKVLLREDSLYLKSDPGLLDTSWYRRCSDKEFRAANALRNRALKQQPAGSLPNDDAELAFLSDLGSSISAWKRVKARALEGWILCADDRYHHPDIARNVLHIWIGRLESRRIGAWGNVSRAKDGGIYGLDSILEDLDEALDALRELDPQDVGLRNAAEQQSKWWGRLRNALAGNPSGEAREGNGAEPIRLPNRMPNRMPKEGSPKVSEAKQSESSREMSGRRPDLDLNPSRKEIEEGRASALQPEDVRATYPPDAFALFWNPFPLKEKRRAAEAAFRKVQEAGVVTFPEMMEGWRRYIRDKPKSHSWRHAATWLNDEGWKDGQCVPVATAPGSASSTPLRFFVAVGTKPWEAWQTEARNRGKPGWPSSMVRDGKNGWEFEAEWPPGVDPTNYGPDPGDRT